MRAANALFNAWFTFLHPISAIQQVEGLLRDRNWMKPRKRVYLYLEDVAARPPVLRGRDGIISWARASRTGLEWTGQAGASRLIIL